MIYLWSEINSLRSDLHWKYVPCNMNDCSKFIIFIFIIINHHTHHHNPRITIMLAKNQQMSTAVGQVMCRGWLNGRCETHSGQMAAVKTFTISSLTWIKFDFYPIFGGQMASVDFGRWFNQIVFNMKLYGHSQGSQIWFLLDLINAWAIVGRNWSLL